MNSTLRLAVLAMLTLTSVSSIAHAYDDAPDASQVFIKNVTFNGMGCQPGTVSYILAPDAKTFSVLFDSFTAETGNSQATLVATRACNMRVQMQFPAGWSYTLFSVDYRGFAGLDAGTWSRQQSGYAYGDGVKPTPFGVQRLNGPYFDDYYFQDVLGLEKRTWSPCTAQGQVLNIGSGLDVHSPSPNLKATMTLDTIDGAVKHSYGITWRRCGATPPPQPPHPPYPPTPPQPPHPPYPPYPPTPPQPPHPPYPPYPPHGCLVPGTTCFSTPGDKMSCNRCCSGQSWLVQVSPGKYRYQCR